MVEIESTVNRWVRRDAKKKAQRKLTSDNRNSVRGSLQIIIKKAKEINDS